MVPSARPMYCGVRLPALVIKGGHKVWKFCAFKMAIQKRQAHSGQSWTQLFRYSAWQPGIQPAWNHQHCVEWKACVFGKGKLALDWKLSPTLCKCWWARCTYHRLWYHRSRQSCFETGCGCRCDTYLQIPQWSQLQRKNGCFLFAYLKNGMEPKSKQAHLAPLKREILRFITS